MITKYCDQILCTATTAIIQNGTNRYGGRSWGEPVTQNTATPEPVEIFFEIQQRFLGDRTATGGHSGVDVLLHGELL